MPLSKEQYEKVIGRKLSDAEYGKLSGAARQDRPADESTFFKPSGINAAAPNGSQSKEAKLEAFGHVKGGSWNHPEGTSKQNKLKGTTLDGGGAYDQGETNVPGTVHNKTLPTEEYSTAPALAGKGAPSRTYHTSTLGDGVGKPGISNKASNAKAAPPNLPVVLAGGDKAPGLAHVGSPSKAPAGTFAPGAPLYAPSPTGAPASIGLLPNVPVTPTGGYAAGMQNTPGKVTAASAAAAIDELPERAVDGLTDVAEGAYDAPMDLYEAVIAAQRKKHGL